MGLSISNKKNVQQEEKLHQIFDGIKSHLNEAFDSVDKSHTYFKIGLEDDFVNYLNKYAENPITMISHSFDGHMDSIRLILEEVSQKFFLSQSKNIYKVFQSNPKGSFLHFYIILKEDTLKNRRPFFSFLNEYDKELLSKQFPIMFEFISQKKEDAVRKEKVINLENEESSKKGKI
jgi:hypothetical protein